MQCSLVISQLTVRGGLYSLYTEDWLNVFPKEQLHFVHYETYAVNRTEELQKLVKFIGLGKFVLTVSIIYLLP